MIQWKVAFKVRHRSHQNILRVHTTNIRFVESQN